MDGKLQSLRDRLLVCAVCMDEYRDPRILPCYHSLCFECITNVIQSSSETGRYFRCPNCRSQICVPSGGVQELPINFYILSLQDELSSKEYEGKCELCETNSLSSEFRCVDCDKDICRFCIHSHRLDSHKDKPQILRIERHPTSSYPTSSNLLCTEHDKERLQLFCYTCDIPICVACSCGRHKTHHLMPLSEKIQELGSRLKIDMNKIESDVKNLCQTNQLMEDIKQEILVLSNNSILALDQAATRACAAINKKKSALEKEILTSEREQLKDLDVAKSTIKTLLRNMNNGYHYLVDLQESDMCLEAFQSFKDFASKLEKYRKDLSKVQIIIQQNHFYPSEYIHIREFPVGFLRNMFYYGRLGSLGSSFMHLSVDSKTLLAKREPYRFSKMCNLLGPFLKQVFIFCLSLLIFFGIFWIYDENEIYMWPLLRLIFIYMEEAIDVFTTKVSNYYQNNCDKSGCRF